VDVERKHEGTTLGNWPIAIWVMDRKRIGFELTQVSSLGSDYGLSLLHSEKTVHGDPKGARPAGSKPLLTSRVRRNSMDLDSLTPLVSTAWRFPWLPATDLLDEWHTRWRRGI